MNEMHSSKKIASVTQGLSHSPSGGTAMPMITNAAMARVPCRPSHASARIGTAKAAIHATGIGVLLWSAAATVGPVGKNEHVPAGLRRRSFPGLFGVQDM